MSQPMPTVGRVVMFLDGVEDFYMVRPAVVTMVNGEVINLNVFNDPTMPRQHEGTIDYGPTFMVQNVPMDRWAWPTIPKAERDALPPVVEPTVIEHESETTNTTDESEPADDPAVPPKKGKR